MECIFCKIIDGEIPAVKVLDEELVLAFMDINPSSRGHTKDQNR
jgi:histidine triad (HIT) family protein